MIVAITGTLGAGKGTVAEHLVKKHDFTYLSVRSFFAEEVLKRGQAVTRENLIGVARAVRQEHGATYAIEQLLGRVAHGGRGIVIESIRTVAEAEYLKAHGATLWCIDTDLKTRYQRFIGRALPVDAVPFEQFAENDKKDLDGSDPAMQNLTAVCGMADVTIDSSGTKEDLYKKVEEALKNPYKIGLDGAFYTAIMAL
jgi:dephospho-CoA kinase